MEISARGGRTVSHLEIQHAHGGNGGSIGIGEAADRRADGVEVFAGSDDLGGGERVAFKETANIGMRTHGLLHVADVQDVGGTVRTLLPGAGTDEEDRDEGEQNEDDDRQFEEGHTGFALHGQGVSQFHSVCILFFVSVGCVVFCRSETDWRFGRILSSSASLSGLGKGWESY
jgi:hypothetical protein